MDDFRDFEYELDILYELHNKHFCNIIIRDISKTNLCGCFPNDWQTNFWANCLTIGIQHNCNCRLQHCENQCDTYNTINCTENACIMNGFGYTCSEDCDNLLYVPIDPFGCKLSPRVVFILETSIPPTSILLITLIIIIYFYRKNQQIIDLPNSWFWDLSRIKHYQKKGTDPVTYYKELKASSKERKFLDSLMVKLELLKFTNLMGLHLFLSSNFASTRKIQIHRMTSSPSHF